MHKRTSTNCWFKACKIIINQTIQWLNKKYYKVHTMRFTRRIYEDISLCCGHFMIIENTRTSFFFLSFAHLPTLALHHWPALYLPERSSENIWHLFLDTSSSKRLQTGNSFPSTDFFFFLTEFLAADLLNRCSIFITQKRNLSPVLARRRHNP